MHSAPFQNQNVVMLLLLLTNSSSISLPPPAPPSYKCRRRPGTRKLTYDRAISIRMAKQITKQHLV